jgi:hypothetical protein
MTTSIDEAKLIVVMACGALFASAGLVLLLRRGSDHQGEQLAEFLGLKFRFSSAGLVVFLVGALFLAAPLFVAGIPSPVEKEQRSEAAGDAPAGREPVPQNQTPSLLQGKETEPNERPSHANPIEIGHTYAGAIRNDEDIDFYVVENRPGEATLRLIVRVFEGGAAVSIFNEDEELMVTLSGDDVISQSFKVREDGRYFVRITNSYGRPNYEIMVRRDRS